MVPAACMLLWALLLSLGSRAAGAQDQTSTSTTNSEPTTTGVREISIHFGGPSRSRRSTASTSRHSVSRRLRVTVEDENDALATADRLAGPAAAELLATVTGMSRASDFGSSEDEDGSLEEGVVIDARKDITSQTPPTTMGDSNTTGRGTASRQEADIQLTVTTVTSKPSGGNGQTSETTAQNRWTSSTSTTKRRPSPSATAMPPPEDLRVALMPWGPWHCHCKSGTMSRSRAGKLQGLSGRLRVGALSELRTEHRPCTYQHCPCNRLLEECPLDTSLCADSSCSTHASTTHTTTASTARLRRRPTLPVPSPSPALAFWKRVRIGLEDIWDSLSSVFTEMQPTQKTRK